MRFVAIALTLVVLGGATSPDEIHLKDGRVFFVEKAVGLVPGPGDTSSTKDILIVRGEERTYELAPESFSVEVLGEMTLKDGDGNQLATLRGGFYLRFTPDRTEIFATAYAAILGDTDGANALISGKATGLIIVVTTLDIPDDDDVHIPGIAASLELELKIGVEDNSGAGGVAGAFGDFFKFVGKVNVMLNTTLAPQEFDVPESFLPFLAPGQPTHMVIWESVPNLSGSAVLDPSNEGQVYISARIQGSITLLDTITLTGFIGIDAGVGDGGATIRFTGAVSTQIQFRHYNMVHLRAWFE